MARHANSIVINAPPEKVFAYVNDPTTHPEWMVNVFETRDAVGSGEGLQYEWTINMAGLRLRGQNVVVEHVANEYATHQCIGMFEAEWTATVELEDRGTKLTVEISYEIPVPVLGKLAEHLAVRRLERQLEASLLNLKESLEL